MHIFDFHAAQAGGSSEAVPLYWWQGWSGRWYVATISTISDFSCAEPGLYIVARREADGHRTPLVIGWASDIETDLRVHRAEDLADACAAGANEIHLHLLDHPTKGRDSIGKDLARAWAMPLASFQPFSASSNPPVKLPRRPAE